MADNAFGVYLKMDAAWRDSIPESLQWLTAETFVKGVRLTERSKGISQSDAAAALGQSQSGMSRITTKLTQEKWATLTRSPDDPKQKVMTITAKAETVMATLGLQLAVAMKDKAAPRRLGKAEQKAELLNEQYGGRDLFEHAETD